MIDLFINNQHLTILQSLIVDNSINYNTLKATFTDDWNGYNKWVHFKCGIAIYDVQLDSDDEIKQSEHLNFGSGIWEVWLHGTDEDGTIRITTDIAIITVIEGGIGDGEPLPDIPLSASEQIAITANNALNIAQSVRDDADNGEFDGISATIAVGATTMLPEGSDATVTNVGDENNAIFDFGIPTGGGTNDYNDLINTPTKLSDFSNDVGYITNADIPTKTSDLTNDSDYTTKTYVDGLISQISQQVDTINGEVI